MMGDVDKCVESALGVLLSVTEESKNLRHDLKENIVKSVSKLRKAISMMKSELTEKDKELNNLKVDLKNTQQLVQTRGIMEVPQMITTAPSETRPQRLQRFGRETLHLHMLPPLGLKKNYSTAVGGKQDVDQQPKTYKVFVKSKAKQSVEYMKTLIKTNLNPVEMKVGVNAFRGLKNGQLLIESNVKAEVDMICRNINEKCGGEVEANVTKLRNPRIIIFNIPEDITVENIVEAITIQNPDLKEYGNDMKPKFVFQDRKKNRNLILEMSSGARKKILERKLKIGWNMCGWDDYIKVGRCFKCCKFNHRAQDCNGELTCPKCTQNHSLKECKASKEEYKCINCCNYKKYNNNDQTVNENHTALDENCPCYLTALRRYQLNTDY